MGALMAILVLGVGSISIAGTSQFVMGLDGNTLKNLLGGCIYGACKDTKVTGNFNPNVTSGIVAGCVFAGCKGVDIGPTPNTATLTVTKVCEGPPHCPPVNDFKITVTGNNPSPATFGGSETGTQVTLGPGQYKITEQTPGFPVEFSVSGNCVKTGDLEASGTIGAGETQKCDIKNTRL